MGSKRKCEMRYLLCVFVVVLAGCNGEDANKQADPADQWDNPTGTYMITQCTVYVESGTSWGHCPATNNDLSNHSGPFQSLDACRQQIEYLISSDTYYLDNSESDRSRGWAIELYCAQIYA